MKKTKIEELAARSILPTDEVTALEDLHEEIVFMTRNRQGFDTLDDEILSHSIAVLGLNTVSHLLADSRFGAGEGSKAVEPVMVTSTRRVTSDPGAQLKEFILKHCHGALETIHALFEDLSWRLEPAVLGGQEVPTNPPSAIQATRLGALDNQTKWQTSRICSDRPLILVSVDRPEHEGARVLNSKPGSKAEVVFDVGRFTKSTTSDQWSAFYVSQNLNFQDDPSRELIIVSAKHADIGAVPPAKLILQGYLAEAWYKAIEDGFSPAELLALQALIWPKMRKLLEGIEAHNPIVNRDITTCMNTLDGRANNVRERIVKMFNL